MLLTAGPSFEFIRFMQILVWIILPLLLCAITVTVFFHYRKKKKHDVTPAEAEDNFVLAAPEQFNHHKSDGEYIFFDHSGLIREYKARMFYNHARYTALRKDYVELEEKYSSLIHTGETNLFHDKKDYMKNQNEQMESAAADQLSVDQDMQNKELADKLEQFNKSYQRLEEENRFLQEQISLQTAGDDEKEKIISRWKEENKALRDRLATQEYLEELLEEKKAQISFLQGQLDHRIINQHRAEQQRQQAIAEREEQENLKHNLQQQSDILKNELALAKEQAGRLDAMLHEKNEQLDAKQQAIGSQLDQVTYLENVLYETKEQNELLSAELADRKDEITGLKQLLEDERMRVQFMEQKLTANKELLLRLYKEFSACVEDVVHESPIVTLRPSYISKGNTEEWDETAVH